MSIKDVDSILDIQNSPRKGGLPDDLFYNKEKPVVAGDVPQMEGETDDDF